MKKLMFIISALVACSTLSVMTASAEQTQKQLKQAEKDATKKAKELKGEGWKTLETKPIESTLMFHNQKITDYGGLDNEVYAESEGTSMHDATIRARTAAFEYIAQEAKSFLTGKVENLLNDGTEKFTALFEQEMMAELGGVMSESFSIYKQNTSSNKPYTVRVCYTYNRTALNAAQQKSFNQSIESSDLSADMKGKLSQITF